MRAVPTALVIEILTNMIVPAVHVLEDYIVVEWNKEALRAVPAAANHHHGHHHGHGHHHNQAAQHGSSNAQAATNQVKAHGGDANTWVKVGRDGATSTLEEATHQNDDGTPAVGSQTVIEQCLSTLTGLILDNFTRLSHYPSFDKLWLRTLQCMIHFSEAPSALTPPEGNAANNNNSGMGFSGVSSISDPVQLAERQRFLQQISQTSLTLIQKMLEAIVSNKVFDQRPALKTITAEFMRQTIYAAPLVSLVDSQPSESAPTTTM